MSHRPVDCQLFLTTLDISLLLKCLQAHKAQLMVHYGEWRDLTGLDNALKLTS